MTKWWKFWKNRRRETSLNVDFLPGIGIPLHY